MVSYYDVGDIVRATSTFTDTGGTKGDPGAVTFVMTVPSGTDVVNQITSMGSTLSDSIHHPSTGQFYRDITTTSSGPYYYRFSSTGTLTSAAEGVFRVRKRYTSTG